MCYSFCTLTWPINPLINYSWGHTYTYIYTYIYIHQSQERMACIYSTSRCRCVQRVQSTPGAAMKMMCFLIFSSLVHAHCCLEQLQTTCADKVFGKLHQQHHPFQHVRLCVCLIIRVSLAVPEATLIQVACLVLRAQGSIIWEATEDGLCLLFITNIDKIM